MPRHEDFSPGDLVKLKSGGPTMIVEAVIRRTGDGVETTTYDVVWFTEDGEFGQATFSDDVLEQSFEGD